jgi:hypothetical protein
MALSVPLEQSLRQWDAAKTQPNAANAQRYNK